jgi:hypothetical protein
MRRILALYIALVSFHNLFAIDNSVAKILEGKVEYISSQFIYVQFKNTEGLNSGDTLFIKSRGKYSPQLVIETLSSRSCATKSLSKKMVVGVEVFGFIKLEEKKNELTRFEPSVDKRKSIEIVKVDTAEFIGFKKMNRGIYGRFSLSGYSNISNAPGQLDYQSWRYSLSLNADHINNSKFSFSNYITFRYRASEWNYIKSNISDALKIYDISLKYDINSVTNVLVGRKINRKVANIGAVDGIQFETIYKKFAIGGILGSRPDYSDYGFNSDLLQIGGYINRTDSIGNGAMQNTISIFQQMNNSFTDRRFLYLQHNNNIIANTSLFLSSEIDLFEKKNNKSNNDPRFTSLYLSLRYSPVRWFSTSVSFDARKNVIYYETFKNYVDQLVESALRQGFRLRVNLRPIKYVFASVYSGYRFRDSDVRPTRNIGGSLTHSRLPYLNLSANLSYINLVTNYLDGNIIGVRLSKDIFDGLVYATVGYKNVDYTFTTTNSKLLQDIIQLDLSFRINKTNSFSISFEGTYEGKTSYSNIYANFSTRF